MMKIKDIPGYEGLYAVSDDGEIWSHRQKKFLKVGRGSSGYKQAQLLKDKHRISVSVHRLVWLTFNGEIPKGLEINHIDENKDNNRLDNLELCTRHYNMGFGNRTARQAEKMKKPFTLTDETTGEVLSFDSLRACGDAFNIKFKSVADYRNKMHKRGDWKLKIAGKEYKFSWK